MKKNQMNISSEDRYVEEASSPLDPKKLRKPMLSRTDEELNAILFESPTPWELLADQEANESSIEQVDLDYVALQYRVYNYLSGDIKAQDQAKISEFVTNTPAWALIWLESYNGLDNVFHLKVWDYDGRSYTVNNITDSEAYKSLSEQDKGNYFYQQNYNDSPDASNNRVEVRIEALKDNNWNHIIDIANNIDKLPEPVRKVLQPYVEKMGLISESRDQAFDQAVATYILGIKNYNKKNSSQKQRLMAAGAALRKFYGSYYTSTVWGNNRRVVDVYDYVASRSDDNGDLSYFALVLWD